MGYTVPMLISEMGGQGVKQFLELGGAFLLSAAIGLEREIRHKSAGLRTYTVVGTAAALLAFVFPGLLRLLPGTPMPAEQVKGSEHD